jgi:coatomer subunit epsilon
LVNIHNAFHQGQYQTVLDFDTSTFSSSNSAPVRALKLRAQLALGQYDEVLSATKSRSSSDLAAIHALAQYLKSPDSGDRVVEEAKKLAAEQGDDLTVQLAAGTVLARSGATDSALELLSKHQGSLDAWVTLRGRSRVYHL